MGWRVSNPTTALRISLGIPRTRVLPIRSWAIRPYIGRHRWVTGPLVTARIRGELLERKGPPSTHALLAHLPDHSCIHSYNWPPWRCTTVTAGKGWRCKDAQYIDYCGVWAHHRHPRLTSEVDVSKALMDFSNTVNITYWIGLHTLLCVYLTVNNHAFNNYI